MPNGDPNFDAGTLEKRFRSVAADLEAFARSHNLVVDKYYHDSAAWFFRFRHPKGGDAHLAVHLPPSGIPSISSVWYLDDYDRFTRFIHHRPLRDVSQVGAKLCRELGVELTGILAVPLGQWTSAVNTFKPVWGKYTKAEFERMHPHLPDPIP